MDSATIVEKIILEHQLIGYLILFIGIFLEGEVVFLSAAILAGQQYLSWGAVILVSLAGLLLSDYAFYYLGRFSKATMIGRWLRNRFASYNNWIDRNFDGRYWQVSFFSKFIYVVNKAVPFLAGWHAIPMKRFSKIQFVSGIIWVGIMAAVGHFLGLVIDIVGVKFVLRRIEIAFLVFIVVFLIVENVLKRIFAKRLSEMR